MVIKSHDQVARVRALLARWPTLSRATIDLGFGDWEDALGAASHVGNREIAERRSPLSAEERAALVGTCGLTEPQFGVRRRAKTP
jgi:hypothetical protein